MRMTSHSFIRTSNSSSDLLHKKLTSSPISSITTIHSARNQISEIEVSISSTDFAYSIRKERIRIQETVTDLLLRLGSLTCCDDACLRECREVVVRKAMALQERIQEEEEEEEEEDPDLMNVQQENGCETDEPGGVEMDERGEEGDRVMGMMKEMWERSAIQMQLLRMLSERVEQLERAFMARR